MNTQRIISSALACLIFPALSPDHVFAAEIRDSFDAGNDNAWSRYEPLASAGGGGMFTFPDGGYRIQAGPSPDPGALGPMRLGSLRSDLSQGNTYAVFDLVDWNNSLNQSFGMLVRASTVGVGTTDGYAFGYSTAGMLSISLVTDEQYTVLASTPVTLDPAARYRFEVGVGEALGFGIYRENGSNPFEFLIVEDRTYLSGAMGFYLQANSPNSGVDATFDNFRALTIVPEPSAVSVFSIAALGGWWMVRRRLNTR